MHHYLYCLLLKHRTALLMLWAEALKTLNFGPG